MARRQDKVSLITGGESRSETARLFIAEGARVHIVGNDEPKLASAVEELGDDAADASVADVTDDEPVIRAVAAGWERVRCRQARLGRPLNGDDCARADPCRRPPRRNVVTCRDEAVNHGMRMRGRRDPSPR